MSKSNAFSTPAVLFEDQDLAVINKPPMVVVNRSQTVTERTIQDWWEERLKERNEWGEPVFKKVATAKMLPPTFTEEYGTPNEIFYDRGGIVHRLDKETSGVMVLAKHPAALLNLMAQFKERQTKKMYACLVHHKFEIIHDTLQLPLARSGANRTKFAVAAEGRVAETEYQVKAFYPSLDIDLIKQKVQEDSQELPKDFLKKTQRGYQGFSLVSCWPKTGRTHQIRVHMAHVTHPIVSDETYLGKKRYSLDSVWCPRLFLHATSLELKHPRTQATETFTAPLWLDLQLALSFLREDA